MIIFLFVLYIIKCDTVNVFLMSFQFDVPIFTFLISMFIKYSCTYILLSRILSLYCKWFCFALCIFLWTQLDFNQCFCLSIWILFEYVLIDQHVNLLILLLCIPFYHMIWFWIDVHYTQYHMCVVNQCNMWITCTILCNWIEFMLH